MNKDEVEAAMSARLRSVQAGSDQITSRLEQRDGGTSKDAQGKMRKVDVWGTSLGAVVAGAGRVALLPVKKAR